MIRFYYRLSLAVGCLHPDHLLAALTSEQLTGWMAYLRLEPIGNEDNRRMGVLASLIHNVNRKKNSDRVTRPGDFAYIVDPPQPKQGWEFIKDFFMSLVKAKKEEK